MPGPPQRGQPRPVGLPPQAAAGAPGAPPGGAAGPLAGAVFAPTAGMPPPGAGLAGFDAYAGQVRAPS
jgi:hypothetical protein